MVYCVELGVKLVRTVSNRPQQNETAKRINRTLNERARAMQLHIDLPKIFLAKTVNTTTYLIN